ncbi:MAG: TIGR00266 family protein [Candidatus Altiarchaeota archaeon]
MEHEIIGDDMQAVKMKLNKGEIIRAEAGAMMYMEPSIQMDAKMEGGIMGGLKRALSKESFFITKFTCTGNQGEVCFSGPYPGKIFEVDISAGKPILCQSDSYLCSTDGIDISIAFTKRLGAGFFGGEGFILQKLAGNGKAFLHSGGTVVEKELALGEKLRVDTGCIVAFDDSVDYDIQMVGGIKTALFGGEGLFLATLTGPGRVVLQTLPFSRLADRIISASRVGRGEVRRGSATSKLIGNIISGD